jgi:hypothetical protein
MTVLNVIVVLESKVLVEFPIYSVFFDTSGVLSLHQIPDIFLCSYYSDSEPSGTLKFLLLAWLHSEKYDHGKNGWPKFPIF